MTIKLPQPYEIAHIRDNVRDAFMMHGERAIALSLYHAGDPDAVPCPVCGEDIYESPEMFDTQCYGTRFNGGVRSAMIVWSLFTDRQEPEQLAKPGIWRMARREVQFQAFPRLREHDTIVRVKSWTDQYTPAEIESFYILQGDLTQRSERPGAQFGQTNDNIVAQRGTVTSLSPSMMGVTMYPIVGQQFSESPMLDTVPTLLQQVPAVTPITYFPFETAPGGVQKYSTTVGDGVSTVFVVTHGLGTRNVLVQLYDMATSEQVDTDVSYSGLNTVTLTFGVPPGTNAYTVVVQG